MYCPTLPGLSRSQETIRTAESIDKNLGRALAKSPLLEERAETYDQKRNGPDASPPSAGLSVDLGNAAG
jgi:hypothetical protein